MTPRDHEANCGGAEGVQCSATGFSYRLSGSWLEFWDESSLPLIEGYQDEQYLIASFDLNQCGLCMDMAADVYRGKQETPGAVSAQVLCDSWSNEESWPDVLRTDPDAAQPVAETPASPAGGGASTETANVDPEIADDKGTSRDLLPELLDPLPDKHPWLRDEGMPSQAELRTLLALRGAGMEVGVAPNGDIVAAVSRAQPGTIIPVPGGYPVPEGEKSYITFPGIAKFAGSTAIDLTIGRIMKTKAMKSLLRNADKFLLSNKYTRPVVRGIQRVVDPTMTGGKGPTQLGLEKLANPGALYRDAVDYTVYKGWEKLYGEEVAKRNRDNPELQSLADVSAEVSAIEGFAYKAYNYADDATMGADGRTLGDRVLDAADGATRGFGRLADSVKGVFGTGSQPEGDINMPEITIQGSRGRREA